MGRHMKKELQEKLCLSLTDKGVATLLISWTEVDRLLEKQEYAAAVLVAAINVEFVLKDHLRQFKDSHPNLCIANSGLKSLYGRDPDELTLGSSFKLARGLTDCEFALKGNWQEQIRPIIEPRNNIAHCRGYFARFTQLKVLTEDQIRKLLDNVHKFCNANPPTR